MQLKALLDFSKCEISALLTSFDAHIIFLQSLKHRKCRLYWYTISSNQGFGSIIYTNIRKDFQINQTKPEFEGDYTVVLFALLKPLKQSPDALGKALGEQLINTNSHLFSSYNVIKGFLNLTISDAYWNNVLSGNYADAQYGSKAKNGKKIVVEYSSPNTNKPLHLGHLRNNFLGWSIAAILKAEGYDIIKTCIANDRGIHICKSMVAWQWFANGATPHRNKRIILWAIIMMFESSIKK